MIYRQCVRCVLDTTDPHIRFDELGECNYCKTYDEVTVHQWHKGPEGNKMLLNLFQDIKRYGRGKEYDCIIGLSGGIDSSFLAKIGSEHGLRMLAVHVDAGWNSQVAVENIERICKLLNIDLITEVIDWHSMQKIQRAFFKSRVVNQDIPQDHAFFAALYKYARKNNIKYVLNGYNVSSENTLPLAWRGFSALDSVHLRDICRKNGLPKIQKFPLINFFTYTIFYMYLKKLIIVSPLNYIDYNSTKAAQVLKRELGWQGYGDKHHESRFTKFHQSYYLPEKFGYDIRKAHLSSLILSGQLDRAKALEELTKPLYKENELMHDIDYICKKLGFSIGEFNQLMQEPAGNHSDYKSSQEFYKRNISFFNFLRGIFK